MDKIRLSGMAFYGYHGVFPEERAIGQQFLVDLVLDVDTTLAAETDDLQHAVDYGKVYDVVRQVVEGPPKHLLEALAAAICTGVLRDFSLVSSVSVEVHKPAAPIPGAFRDVSVVLSRSR